MKLYIQNDNGEFVPLKTVKEEDIVSDPIAVDIPEWNWIALRVIVPKRYKYSEILEKYGIQRPQ